MMTSVKLSFFYRLAKNVIILLCACSPIFDFGFTGIAADSKPKFDRSPKNLGTVMVFSGTGWYRHPEVPAISGWLARLDADLKMQVDVSELSLIHL